MREIPLADNHHFALEYFFYMPSPTDEGEYLVFWNHEQMIATESGIEHLSPPQKELLLIRYPTAAQDDDPSYFGWLFKKG